MTKPKRHLDLRGKQERAAEAKAANQREAGIAKAYLNAGPSIGNLARAAYHWYNSVPMLGGQNESGNIVITGEAPNPSFARNPKSIIDFYKKFYNASSAPKADRFVNFLSNRTNKTIKRVPIKDTKIGDVYSDGYSYVDEAGNEIAHIAGNKRGNDVFVESSYVSPEYRSQGIGKQMYFDFNQQTFDKFGTTLHSSPYQHQATLEVEPGSGIFISPSSKLWRGLKQNNMATIQGQGLNKYYVMETPSNIKTEFKYGGSIHIAPSKRGTFTAAATKHGMGVQEFAARVLRNKEDYSPSLVKKANFARNASKWNH